MKQSHLLLVLLSTVFVFSCQKEPTESTSPPSEDDGCIERIHTPITAHFISAANMLKADSLFIANGIDKTNCRYSSYSNDSLQTYFPPFEKYDEKIIVVDQYSNDTWITYNPILYYFKNNVLLFSKGTHTAGTALDTASGNLNLKQLRKLFMDDILNFEMSGATYKDSCFTAEFVYFNQNAGTGNPEKLIKAWKLSLKGRSTIPNMDVPRGFYRIDGTRIAYTKSYVR